MIETAIIELCQALASEEDTPDYDTLKVKVLPTTLEYSYSGIEGGKITGWINY